MMRSSTNTKIINIRQVPVALVTTFVRNTPEGTVLWNALCQWRTHYTEKQTALKRFEKLKNPTPTRKEAETEFHKSRNRLKRSYKAAVEAFEAARDSEFVQDDYAPQLAAIAKELGITFETPKPGDQMHLHLNA